MRYQRVISRCSIFKFWKACSKTNDSFIFLILLTISGDCREALPSFPLQTSPYTSFVVLGKPGGRDGRVIVQTIPQSPPAFYLEILYFSYNLIFFTNFSGAPSARTARPFFSYILLANQAHNCISQGHRPRGSCALLFLIRPRPTKRNSMYFLRLLFINIWLFMIYSDVNSHLL